jgi:hypothetical protein
LTHSLTQKLGVCSLAAVLTVTTSAAGFAAEPPAPAPPSSTLLASGTKRVQQLARMTPPAPARSAQAQEGAGGYDEPGSFFRSKRGVVLLVLAAAGVGYMTYSAFNDRIHSDARERLTN